MTLKTLFASAAFVVAAQAAFADGMANVEKFYTFFATSPVQFTEEGFAPLITDDWTSTGNYSGESKNMETFLQDVAGTSQFIPDFKLSVQEIHDAGDAIIVRGRATGTPAGPFLGVDGEGRSFDIMTIDIHEIRDGKIAHSYHVEDWAGAMGQLSGQ